MPLHKVLFWSGFGVAVRLWQLGIEMRPLFSSHSLWVYPVYAGVGGSFGYWLMGVEQRQISYLQARRETLLEKRARRAQREGVQSVEGVPGMTGVGIMPQEGRQAGLGPSKGMEQ